MNVMDDLIAELFKSWTGPESDNLELAKRQPHKNLQNQIDGYWSGSTAYWIMTHGGFLVDAHSGKPKKLTALGEIFMKSMECTKCQS